MVEALENRNETTHMEVIPEEDKVVTLPTLNTSLPALSSIHGKPLRFAPGETLAPRAVPAEKPGARARRPPRLDLFDMAVVVLIVACAAACVYRLFWAIQS